MATNPEAIRLAQASDWKALQRLMERAPEQAQERGDHGMLPLHWACTVRHVPLALVARLLRAYPDGVRAKNTGGLLPLHIAIRARAQASCLRKLVRAYPESVHECTPDGVSALELAEQLALDADALKVLYRAHERWRASQQQQEERTSSDSDGELVNEAKAAHSGQNEGEASGGAPEDEQDAPTSATWAAALPDPFVGNLEVGGFLANGDDVAPLTGGSISMLMERSLSDSASLDTPHGHLVSPSSSSASSVQESAPTPSSAMSPAMLELPHGRHTSAFTDTSRPLSREPQTRKQAQLELLRLLDSLPPSGSTSNRELRRLVSAMSASAAVTSARDLGVDDSESEAGTTAASHSRHQSLPMLPSYDNLRSDATSHFYDRVEDDDGSSRDSDSQSGNGNGNGNGNEARLSARMFQSAQYPAGVRAAQTHGARSQHAGSPPMFPPPHRRASHGHVRAGGGHLEAPPEWKHDDECSVCRASFGMFKHRHHCRNCGKSICSQHSADKKISMEAKGFTTPQRVCVTCYAMITHSRSLKQDLELDNPDSRDSLLNSVAFQQQHYALATGANKSNGNATRNSTVRWFPSATTPGHLRSTFGGEANAPAASDGVASPHSMIAAIPPTTSARRSSSIAAGEATGGAGERATASLASAAVSAGAGASAGAGNATQTQVQAPVHELRCLLASQQKQIEQLAQSNMQMQQQLLEQEELKAETMLLITQLMTRVSVLEMRKERSSSKRRSVGTGDSEDFDEEDECPQHDEHGELAFKRGSLS